MKPEYLKEIILSLIKQGQSIFDRKTFDPVSSVKKGSEICVEEESVDSSTDGSIRPGNRGNGNRGKHARTRSGRYLYTQYF